ncbi:MAG: amidohydrolase family protein [Clostridiales Family XIII bacterium]|jgi:predicted amidohydrolase YtcJ|nr:amidohydrolase family protein [Clostridiales Family XIII bacterium]
MAATILIKGNAIFDGMADAPFPGAVAIEGNRITAVLRADGGADSSGSGSRAEGAGGSGSGSCAGGTDFGGLVGAGTQVIDAGDRLVLPGFHDNHVHLLMAGMFREYVNLSSARSAEEAARMAWESSRKRVDNDVARSSHGSSQGKGWLVGFQWYHIFWDVPEMPTKETLDRYFPDRPVFLLNAEAHGCWLNSRGLAEAGITKDTPDPPVGVIVRDAAGEPTGILLEGAAALATQHALVFTPDRERALIRAYMEGARAYGITSITDVQPYFHGNMGDLSVYSAMDRENALTTRIHVAPDLLGDLDEVLAWRDAYRSERITVNHVKQFLDGVVTTHTALLLEDYADEPGQKGIELFDLDAIRKAIPEAHRRGLSLKLHCIGDRAARIALDNIEEAIRLHGDTGCRHAIEHCELVDEADIPRFGQLGVIPSMQPDHLALTQVFAENPYPSLLGERRARDTMRWKTLLGAAGVLAAGSDCPVVDNNPFKEIHRARTRVHDDGEPAGGWNPPEKLTMSEVLRAYTYGSAYSVKREQELGSLRAGNFADIAVLDRNLFETAPEDILDAKVDLTVFDGQVVYERE